MLVLLLFVCLCKVWQVSDHGAVVGLLCDAQGGFKATGGEVFVQFCI